MKKILIIISSVFMILLIQSCIYIKSSVQEVTLYKLKQEPTQDTKAEAIIIDKSIYVQEFTAATELTSEKIVVENGIHITKFNYHQWVSPLAEMLTDFTINRFNKYKTFKKGVFDSAAMLPDLMLECRVVSSKINNSIDKNSPNTVELIISANVFALEEMSPGFKPVMSEVYKKTIARADNTMNSAVAALSKCASEIIDDVIFDIKMATK